MVLAIWPLPEPAQHLGAKGGEHGTVRLKACSMPPTQQWSGVPLSAASWPSTTGVSSTPTPRLAASAASCRQVPRARATSTTPLCKLLKQLVCDRAHLVVGRHDDDDHLGMARHLGGARGFSFLLPRAADAAASISWPRTSKPSGRHVPRHLQAHGAEPDHAGAGDLIGCMLHGQPRSVADRTGERTGVGSSDHWI